MPAQAAKLFLPGWGAPPELYADGLPSGWSALRPPRSPRGGGGVCERHAAGLPAETRRGTGPVVPGGHSRGAALALAVAAELPDRVERLVLVAPAGLPLSKPFSKSLRDFGAQL